MTDRGDTTVKGPALSALSFSLSYSLFAFPSTLGILA